VSDRFISIQGVFVGFEFLHSVPHGVNAGDIFDWPRDDAADIHFTCVFEGPVHSIGINLLA